MSFCFVYIVHKLYLLKFIDVNTYVYTYIYIYICIYAPCNLYIYIDRHITWLLAPFLLIGIRHGGKSQDDAATWPNGFGAALAVC